LVADIDIPDSEELIFCAKTIADDLKSIDISRFGKKHQLTKPLKNAIKYAELIASIDPKSIDRREKINGEKPTIIARRLAVSLQDWSADNIHLDPNSEEYENKKKVISHCKSVITHFGNP